MVDEYIIKKYVRPKFHYPQKEYKRKILIKSKNIKFGFIKNY